MDDEVLACGALIARLPKKENVHVVYATDGSRSPSPIFPQRGSVPPNLVALRIREAESALDLLGVGKENLRFLGLPDGRLQEVKPKLRQLLEGVADDLEPDHVLVPFRFDRHPDHLAVNEVMTDLSARGILPATLWEYFVYYRWRLLSGGDIRNYLSREDLIQVEIGEVARRKRASLDCFTTQTTRYCPWQARPILTPELLDEECVGPEFFLRFDLRRMGAQVFQGSTYWIRIVHRLEPILQKVKVRMKTLLSRQFWRSIRG